MARLTVFAAAVACTRGEPPGASATASATAAPTATPTSTATATSTPTATPPRTATATATPSSTAGTDPATLPQTRDKPAPASAELAARAQALWDGIVQDDPERALPFFFPLGAYKQVKAIANPEHDWKHRLVAAYSRDVKALHAKLGAGAANAKLVGLEITDARARWVEPNEEYNTIGYYRVFGSRLRYELDGKEGSFEITSLISWRGQWYVVHLSGMK